MLDIQEKQLMEKFLTKNYPIYRLKNNGKFKRTIVLESGGRYHLSDKKIVNELYYKLFDILKIVFNPDATTSKNVLLSFLNLKKNASRET